MPTVVVSLLIPDERLLRIQENSSERRDIENRISCCIDNRYPGPRDFTWSFSWDDVMLSLTICPIEPGDEGEDDDKDSSSPPAGLPSQHLSTSTSPDVSQKPPAVSTPTAPSEDDREVPIGDNYGKTEGDSLPRDPSALNQVVPSSTDSNPSTPDHLTDVLAGIVQAILKPANEAIKKGAEAIGKAVDEASTKDQLIKAAAQNKPVVTNKIDTAQPMPPPARGPRP